MNTLKDYVNFRLTHADKVAEAKGYPLTMENCKKYKKMRDLKMYGNSVQDGTPTPDNPIEVQSVGEPTINLFDENKFLSISGVQSNENEFYISNSVLWGNNRSYSDNIAFKENTQYTIGMVAKCTGGGGRFKVVYTDGTTSYVTAPATEYTTITYVTTANKTISYIGGHYNTAGTFYVQKNSMFVYEGTGITEYEPYGKYKIPVVQRGVNLTDGIIEVKGIANSTGQNSNSSGYFRSTNYTSVSPNTPYTLTASKPIQFVYFYDKDYNFIKSSDENAIYFTTPENCEYIRYRIIRNESLENEVIDRVMLTKGTAQIPYEPYIEPTTTNIFLDEPLRKIGNYADYIDFKENKVVRKNYKFILPAIMDDTQWTYGTGVWDREGHTDFIGGYVSKPIISQGYKAYSNRFVAGKWTWNGNPFPGNYFLIGLYDSRMIHVIINNKYLKGITEDSTTEEKIEAFKTFLTENETCVIYPMAEPIEESINIELPKLNTKTTIIKVDTSLAPSDAYGKYIKR